MWNVLAFSFCSLMSKDEKDQTAWPGSDSIMSSRSEIHMIHFREPKVCEPFEVRDFILIYILTHQTDKCYKCIASVAKTVCAHFMVLGKNNSYGKMKANTRMLVKKITRPQPRLIKSNISLEGEFS